MYFVLTQALEDFAATERDQAAWEEGNSSRERWADLADTMRAQVETARNSGLQRIAGTCGHADLNARCIAMLGIFRLSRQIATIDRILRRLTDAGSACSLLRPAPAR